MTTTTREAALEAALKLARNRLQACAIDHPTGSREMYERSRWADEATAALSRLSTPATEPQGYVEITEEMIVAGRKAADDQYYKWCGFGPREDGQGLDGMHFIVREALKAALSTQATKYAVPADWPKKMLPLDEHVTPGAGPLAARPAPQPAADTRVVTVAQLERWWHITGSTFNALPVAQEIRAIIGTATPAQSDKIAEAAQDKTAAELVIDAYDAANPFRQADMHPALCHCNRCAIDWLRALAGKGE